MRCGVMKIIQTRAQSIRTLFICGKSWNQILKSRVSFLPFTVLAISLLVSLPRFCSIGITVDRMNSVTQPIHTTAARRALDTRSQVVPRAVPRKPGRQELEIKLAELQKDYAALHT